MNNADRKWEERAEDDLPSPVIQPSEAFPLVWYPVITEEQARESNRALLQFLKS